MAGLSRARLSSPAAPIITESPTAVIGPAGAGTSAGAAVEAASVVASVVSGLADEASVWIDSTERYEGGPAVGRAPRIDRPPRRTRCPSREPRPTWCRAASVAFLAPRARPSMPVLAQI